MDDNQKKFSELLDNLSKLMQETTYTDKAALYSNAMTKVQSGLNYYNKALELKEDESEVIEDAGNN